MDRLISSKERRAKKIKWALAGLITFAVGLAGIQFIFAKIRPNLTRNELLIGIVDRGPVNAVIETSGTMVPEQEQVLTAPGETRILSVVHKPGSFVTKGDPILRLDVTTLELERDSLVQLLGVKENEKSQAMLQFEKQVKQDRAKLELIELDLQYFEAYQRQQAQLFEKGLVAKEALQQAQLQFKKKQVEKRQLKDARADAKSSHLIELQGFALELNLLVKSLARAEKRLNRATTHAPADGVLTWVVAGEGTTVRSGEPLARIADLSHFKVTATISDFYADRLRNHQEAIIKIGNAELSGHIARLLPEVTNGIMTFEISFENPTGLPLRPNQRVTVLLLTAKRKDVLRIRRSTALSSFGRQMVFVCRGNTAVRTQAEFGVTGSKYTEIIHGLELGDQIILSDLGELNHLKVIPIK